MKDELKRALERQKEWRQLSQMKSEVAKQLFGAFQLEESFAIYGHIPVMLGPGFHLTKELHKELKLLWASWHHEGVRESVTYSLYVGAWEEGYMGLFKSMWPDQHLSDDLDLRTDNRWKAVGRAADCRELICSCSSDIRHLNGAASSDDGILREFQKRGMRAMNASASVQKHGGAEYLQVLLKTPHADALNGGLSNLEVRSLTKQLLEKNSGPMGEHDLAVKLSLLTMNRVFRNMFKQGGIDRLMQGGHVTHKLMKGPIEEAVIRFCWCGDRVFSVQHMPLGCYTHHSFDFNGRVGRGGMTELSRRVHDMEGKGANQMNYTDQCHFHGARLDENMQGGSGDYSSLTDPSGVPLVMMCASGSTYMYEWTAFKFSFKGRIVNCPRMLGVIKELWGKLAIQGGAGIANHLSGQPTPFTEESLKRFSGNWPKGSAPASAMHLFVKEDRKAYIQIK
jgi:hypothetical protein